MSDQLLPGSVKPRPFLHWTLFIYTFLIGLESGAGAFVTIVVFPLWAASPEKAIGWRPEIPYYLEEGDFFMFASPSVTLAAIVVLFTGWRSLPPLRMWVIISTICFLIVFVWSVIYFIPIQDTTFKGEAGTKLPREELGSKLRMFVNLNYIRQVILLFAFGGALHALGISYRMRGGRK